MLRRIAAIASVIALACAVPLFASDPPDLDQPVSNQPWTAERANAWYSAQPWLVGSNFISSTAMNELEMWQADTFDLPTIRSRTGMGAKSWHEYHARISAQSALAAGLRRLPQTHG
jgi:hypothetical protein